MFTVKRNQVVICALVVMIGVAGYLNYIDTGVSDTQMVLSDNLELTPLFTEGSQDTTTGINTATTTDGSVTASTTTDNITSVDGTIVPDGAYGIAGTDSPEISLSNTTLTLAADSSKPGDAVFVNGSSDTSYFVQAKLDREQVRAKEKDMLMEMVNSQSTPAEKKSEAADKVLSLQQRIEKESSAEAMIESKGFNGVYVRIDDDTVDVVINKSELTEQEIAQIQDIVSRKTGLTAEKIRINTLKK